MGIDDDGMAKFANSEWLKFICLIIGHAVVVFSALLFWANRIVTLEAKVEGIENTIGSGFSEVRSDIKEILKRTKQ